MMLSRNMDHLSTLIALASGLTVILIFHSAFYSSHITFKTQTVFESQTHLPGSVYLLTRYIYQSFRKKRGQMRKHSGTNDQLVYTLINCRYDVLSLRSFCRISGYGWDYPESVFRDLPLCFPEFLFNRLIHMIVCSERFKLSPSGLLVVGETVSLSEAVDELKKGPFTLQASVFEYRTVSSGVEVDLTLTASRCQQQQPVWNSKLTLLSPKNTYRSEAQPELQITHDPASERCISLAVPWTTRVRCAWVFGDLCPMHGFIWSRFIRPTTHPLWMFARCMAEMEKHKGVEVVRAPLTVSVCYKQSVCLPKKVNIRVSENTSETSNTASFSMEEQKTGTLFLSGQIKRQ